MKKSIFIYLIPLFLCVFILVGCNKEEASIKQSATAKVSVNEETIAIMNVDLTGGYSVEFSSGAAYFFKGDLIEDSEVMANVFVIDKSTYEEEISYFKDNTDLEGTFKELSSGGYSYITKDNAEYFYPSNDDLYLKVVVNKEAIEERDSIYKRFSASLEE